jgi:hypothetical protein
MRGARAAACTRLHRSGGAHRRAAQPGRGDHSAACTQDADALLFCTTAMGAARARACAAAARAAGAQLRAPLLAAARVRATTGAWTVFRAACYPERTKKRTRPLNERAPSRTLARADAAAESAGGAHATTHA